MPDAKALDYGLDTSVPEYAHHGQDAIASQIASEKRYLHDFMSGPYSGIEF